jgi:hypothetical protein
MPSLAVLRTARRGLALPILAAVALAALAAGCTQSTLLESQAKARSTTTTMGIRPVPNGGTQLPDAPSSTDTTTATTGSAGPTTTGAPSVSSVQSATATKTPSTTRPRATSTTQPAAQSKAATSATPKAVTTTTTTAPPPPPPSSTTTTTSLPTNPNGIIATVSPSFAVQGSTQLFQYALSDPGSGPVPSLTSCTGTDYMLDSSGGYVLAPFQSTWDCSTGGEVLRTLPADAPLGVYQMCVALSGQPTVVCTPYYVINFSTSFR